MFAICIEASHSKGMGHLFRMLNFTNYLKKQSEDFIFVVNNDDKTKNILKSRKILFEIVDVKDVDSSWEDSIIQKYNIAYWINDRLDTEAKHTKRIRNKGVKLITFDDIGSGAKYSHINICGLFFQHDNLEGDKILKGVEYLILNNDIDEYKRTRSQIDNILVTLGGSDTYGVTVKVLKLLKKYSIKATIHIGMSFVHFKELEKELTTDYKVITNVASLMKEFNKYDLAITGGGITPFEANASGLPCVIIANELFEIPNGKFLDNLNSSKFIGYYEQMDKNIFKDLSKLDIKNMSKNGMHNLNTKAVEKIYKEIKLL